MEELRTVSRRVAPHWLVPALIGLCCAVTLALVVLTPPLEVPDEMQHFYRAYQLSAPGTAGRIENGAAGADLPASLSDMTRHFLGTAAIHAPRSVSASPLVDTLAYRGVPLDRERTSFTIFSSQITYSPLAYIPQALAIVAGRAFGFGPLPLLYAARAANALVALLAIGLAMWVLPAGRTVIAAVAFLPMSATEIASASADSGVIASAILFTAIAVRGFTAEGWRWQDVLLGLLAALVFTTAKPPYLPLAALALPALAMGPRRPRDRAFSLGVPALCTVGCWLWLRHAAPLLVVAKPGLPPDAIAAQLAAIRSHPLVLLSVLGDVGTKIPYLVVSMIGVLGWMTVPLPLLGYGLGLLAIAASILCCGTLGGTRSVIPWIWTLLLAALSLGLVAAALYLTWTPAGSGAIEGLQGRYALPLLPAILVSVAALVRAGSATDLAYHEVVPLALSTLTLLIGAATVVERFGVFG